MPRSVNTPQEQILHRKGTLFNFTHTLYQTRYDYFNIEFEVGISVFKSILLQDFFLETDLSRGFYSENTRNYNTATRTTAICHILYRLVYTACKKIHYFLLIIIIANLIE